MCYQTCMTGELRAQRIKSIKEKENKIESVFFVTASPRVFPVYNINYNIRYRLQCFHDGNFLFSYFNTNTTRLLRYATVNVIDFS